MKYIIALGPNPAWQKTLFFPEFRYGHVNRADKIMIFPSGKGINFCRAARCWDGLATLLLQFAGGETGHKIQTSLDEEGLKHITVQTPGETRTCTTCLCRKTQVMTEIIDPSYPVPPEQIEEMLRALEENLNNCHAISLLGTVPDGTGCDLYLRTAQIAREHNLPILVDAWQHVDKILNIGGRMILKVNLDELSAITGTLNPQEAFKSCFDKYPLAGIAATDGPGTAFAATRNQVWSYRLPVLEQIVSPLGSGDTTAAVFMSEYLSGQDFGESFASALAAGSANCLTPLCGSYDKAAAEQIRRDIKIEKF